MGRKGGKVLEEEAEDREEQLCIVPRLFALQRSADGDTARRGCLISAFFCFLFFFLALFFLLSFFGARQPTATSSILDFFIRFLSSRMRFKRNGSYTLNR